MEQMKIKITDYILFCYEELFHKFGDLFPIWFSGKDRCMKNLFFNDVLLLIIELGTVPPFFSSIQRDFKSMPMHEIAAYCGFSDLHHLSKTFRRMTGETPGVYRKTETSELCLRQSVSASSRYACSTP
ncbi:helix-turn-helix domain-containing protein [Paenibacillus sp. NPDC057886]|uniref:helix-turn-helix domain-containing protein n=1 Tax=Paenibacillus sp. NPDC057886 TaxID=3346270 RepID=UPI0036BF97EC